MSVLHGLGWRQELNRREDRAVAKDADSAVEGLNLPVGTDPWHRFIDCGIPAARERDNLFEDLLLNAEKCPTANIQTDMIYMRDNSSVVVPKRTGVWASAGK